MIFFMKDNHTFIRLDNIKVEDAIKKITDYFKEGNYNGFVGDHIREPYQFNIRHDLYWMDKVREYLKQEKVT